MHRMLQLAPCPERQRTARCCAHCKDGSSPRLGTAVSESRGCRLQSKASVTVEAEGFVGEENKRCYLEVESIFLCAADDFTSSEPASPPRHFTRCRSFIHPLNQTARSRQSGRRPSASDNGQGIVFPGSGPSSQHESKPSKLGPIGRRSRPPGIITAVFRHLPFHKPVHRYPGSGSNIRSSITQTRFSTANIARARA